MSCCPLRSFPLWISSCLLLSKRSVSRSSSVSSAGHMKRVAKRISQAALLCSVWLLFSAHCPAQGLASKVDEYMSTAVKRSRFVGSILVARDGKVLVSLGYGMANLEGEVSNTARTKFRPGSPTQRFTALGVSLLPGRGAARPPATAC